MTRGDEDERSKPESELRPGVDLRGRNLAGLDLRGVDLRGATAGMPPGRAAVVVAGGLALSVAGGVAAGASGRIFQRLLESDEPLARVVALVAAAALVLFLGVTLWRGPTVALVRVLPVVSGLALIGALIGIATGLGTGRAGLILLALSLALAAIAVLASLARAVAGTAGTAFFVVAALTGALVGSKLGGGIASVLIAVGSMLAGRRALKGDTSLRGLPRLVARIACRAGTSFRDADLRDADLRGASLRATDFRGARLEGARFEGTVLDLALFDGPPPRSASGPDAGEGRRDPTTEGAKPIWH